MKKLILVCGPAGIGKSTFCRKYAANHPDETVRVVASDEIRKAMTGSYQNFLPGKNMMPVYLGVIKEANRLLQENKDVTVMLDTTMLNDERRLFFVDRIQGMDETDLYLLKLHDYRLCFARNKSRVKEKWVPEEVIDDMIRKYQDPSLDTRSRFLHVETVFLDD